MPERRLILMMMLILYNLLLAVCLPVLALAALLRAKYRGRTLERLGLRLKCLSVRPGPVIWLHALSVGEVSSALPLLKGIRKQLCPAQIVFTVSTRSGKELAETLLRPHVDLILFSPFDLRFAIRRYLDAIRPDIFLLVETDFWPNWLDMLQRRKVPVMLVNGRISGPSFAAYRRFAFFFRPMFRCFNLMSMQTAHDRDKMLALGVPAERLAVLGNLKYDLPAQQATPPDLAAEHGQRVWVCGSTHPGEEEMIFAAFKAVMANPCVHPSCAQGRHRGLSLQLILAPRQISRGSELVRLASRYGLEAELRSKGIKNAECRILILDTIGELAGCYSLAHLAFIGGSLVDEGGHNPIEAAAQGVPVLFGPHMEDFAEIARDLTACGGAKMVTAESLAKNVAALLADDSLHARMSEAARQLVEQQRGGVERHLQAIRLLLENLR
jgi:3-deoxy-D-manno-octulosonic-acid transferase